MARPFPPRPSQGQHPGPGGPAVSAVASVEPSSTTSDLVDQARAAGRGQWGPTTAATTSPTVRSSSRAGMQTETVRPALAAEHPGGGEVGPMEGPGPSVISRSSPIAAGPCTRRRARPASGRC